jgi:omega-6 fatty acid desaturase (delta-12 desaturase)
VAELVKATAEVTASALQSCLRSYRTPHSARALLELAVTVVPLAVLWGAAGLAIGRGHWWAVLLTLPAAAFLLRLFMVQHDCGHGAFFPHKAMNDWTGRLIGVFTLTPYDHWKREHAKHHATSGNLDRRGFGDVEMLTVAEYMGLPPWRRLGYRLFRHPAVMFGLGPIFVFFIRHRLPVGEMGGGWRSWFSPMATNLAIAGAAIGLVLVGGMWPLLLIQLPTCLIAGTIGVWLFYVQHQFEGVAWARNARWTQTDAALHGSSHYHLPGPAGWFTANIGVHHVHHLSSRIPFYRLRRVLREHPELDAGRLSFAQSLRGVGLALWDEESRRLISFRDLSGRVR